jgi:hypothetical protein
VARVDIHAQVDRVELVRLGGRDARLGLRGRDGEAEGGEERRGKSCVHGRTAVGVAMRALSGGLQAGVLRLV